MSLKDDVWNRAAERCEYCHLPQAATLLPHEVDHIIAQKHDGETCSENLCLACYSCNAYKGPNVAGIDPETGDVVRLFHPRRDVWSEHFRWNGPILIGLTAIGRVTIRVLRVNQPERVQHRELHAAIGDWKPNDG